MISEYVYMYLKDNSIDKIKLAIDNLLKLTGNNFHWNDFFEIYEDFDEDYAKRQYDECYEKAEESNSLTREELLNFIHTFNDSVFDEYPSIETWITVKPIKEEAKLAAESLNNLHYLYSINAINDY